MSETVSQKALAEDISSKIDYEFIDKILVKPLPKQKVKKTVSKPVVKTETATTDENGVEATEYDDVEQVTEEVEADICEGIVLKVPHTWKMNMQSDKMPAYELRVGDTVAFKYGQYFDILKDTMMISSYDLIAVKHND